MQTQKINTIEEFKTFTEDFKAKNKMPLCFGIAKIDLGEADSSGNKKVLQATYPVLNFNENFGSFATLLDSAKYGKEITKSENELIYEINLEFINNALNLFSPYIAETLQDSSQHKNIQVILELKRILKNTENISQNTYRFIALYEDKPCISVETAYMKLLALSLGRAKLRSLNLNGIFGLLPNLAWSGNKPFELEYLRKNEITMKLNGIFPNIDFVDKFPRYLMQVIPQHDNIRLLDSANTRFGAYLGSGGYTQMPGASYVNFNSGVVGACMNEGRISSSVIIGEGTDIGGGASILGVLSGGNNEPISIGKNCLLGANSVSGISLGDGCIVDAGIAVLAGGKFYIDENEFVKIKAVNSSFSKVENNIYKGSYLSGLSGIHYRQDSNNGKMIAKRSAKEIALNKDLH